MKDFITQYYQIMLFAGLIMELVLNRVSRKKSVPDWISITVSVIVVILLVLSIVGICISKKGL